MTKPNVPEGQFKHTMADPQFGKLVPSDFPDEEMFERVRSKASQGSPMHIKALNIYARRHLTQDSSSNGHRTHY